MDWLTFISELVKALAWPAGVVSAIALLRRPLTELIPQLREFRYRNFRLTARNWEQLERRANKIGLPLPEKPKPPKQEAAAPSTGSRYYLPIGVPPGLVVLHGWQEIETALLEAATRHGIDRQRGNIKQIARQLEAAGVLPHEVGE